MPHSVSRTLPVEKLIDRLAHKELALKNAGAMAEAAGVRDSIVAVLRMADEEQPKEPTLEPDDE